MWQGVKKLPYQCGHAPLCGWVGVGVCACVCVCVCVWVCFCVLATNYFKNIHSYLHSTYTNTHVCVCVCVCVCWGDRGVGFEAALRKEGHCWG